MHACNVIDDIPHGISSWPGAQLLPDHPAALQRHAGVHAGQHQTSRNPERHAENGDSGPETHRNRPESLEKGSKTAQTPSSEAPHLAFHAAGHLPILKDPQIHRLLVAPRLRPRQPRGRPRREPPDALRRPSHAQRVQQRAQLQRHVQRPRRQGLGRRRRRQSAHGQRFGLPEAVALEVGAVEVARGSEAVLNPYINPI